MATQVKHMRLTQDQMRAKAGSNGDFDGPNPACSNGSAHVDVTDNRAHVTCAACLLALDPAKRGPLNSYKVSAVAELAASIKVEGFRVFIAESGTYGFFTDVEGTRVVSFQYDLGGFKFSGNYKTSAPRQTGTGWQLADDNFAGLFAQHAPLWATGGHDWKHTTLAQHLATYQPSSRFTEVAQ